MSPIIQVASSSNSSAGIAAPVITSGGAGTNAVYQIDENARTVDFIQALAVPGRSALSYSIIGGADASKFTINSATGKLNFINAADYEKPGDTGGDNVYNVTVSASDGFTSDTQAISVVVQNVNEAPKIISNGGGLEATLQVAENTSFVTTVISQDPDADAKTVHSIDGGADAAKFTIDASTGALKFISAPNFEKPDDVGKDNVYDVVVKSSDGARVDTQTLHVKVTDVVENIASAAAAQSASAGKITVSNATELMSALKSARGGETIELKAGDYGDLRLNANSGIPQFASQVTIKSADASKPAIFHNVNFSDIDNVKFDSLKFDYNAKAGASLSESPFKFVGCSGITVTNTQITGDVARGVNAIDDGYGTGRALVFLKGTNIEVSNNTISEFFRAAAFGNTTGLKVTGNNISNISSDGLNFADVDNVIIDSNQIHDFNRNGNSLAHPDMIQFWTTGTTSPSTNIVISNNFLDMGGGVSTQSIFMRNELVDKGMAGAEMFYKNVTIANNLIANQHNNGITVGATNGLVIDNNTLIQKVAAHDSQGAAAPSINVSFASVNVKLTDNVSPVFGGCFDTPKSTWLVSNNHVVQSTSPNAPNYAGDVYSDFLDKTGSSIADYALVPGGPLYGKGVGSTLTQISKTPGLTGFLQSEDVGHGPALSQSFNASNVFLNGVKVNMAGAKVVWDFGDKTIGSGIATQHVYSKPGIYEAKATITLADNKVVVIDKTIAVVSDHLLNLDFNNSFVDRSLELNNFSSLKAASAANVLNLNGGYVKYHTDANFFGNSEFTVLADFKKDAAASLKGGTLLYFSKVFTVNVGTDGVQVNISTTKGPVTLSAEKIGLANNNWHKLAVTFSGENGTASLFVDGKLAASAAVKLGSTQLDVSNADFFVGAPAGGSFVGSVDNVHYLSEALTAKEALSNNPITSWMSASAAGSAFAAADVHQSVDVNVSPLDIAIPIVFPNDINLL